MKKQTDKELAKELHYKYEEFAEQEKWKTNYFCNKMPFDSLPIKNQRVMLKMADLVNNKIKESQKGMIKIEDIKQIMYGKIDWIKVFKDAYENRKTSWNEVGYIREWRNATDEILFALWHQLEVKLKEMENKQ